MYERACKCPPGHPLFHSSDASCCLPDSRPLSGLGRSVSVPAKDPGKYWTVERGRREAQMQVRADMQPGIKAGDVGTVVAKAQYRGAPGVPNVADTVPSDRALYVTRRPALGALLPPVGRPSLAPVAAPRPLPQTTGMPSCGAPVNGQCAGDCYYYCPTKSCVPNMISTPPILPGQCDESLGPPLVDGDTGRCVIELPALGCLTRAQAVAGGVGIVAFLTALGAGIYFATRDA